MPDDQLGRALLEALTAVDVLILQTPAAVLADLQSKRQQLVTQLGRVVDTNLDQASQQYKAATVKLQSASATIKQALDDVAKVAQAVAALGQALELAARLKP